MEKKKKTNKMLSYNSSEDKQSTMYPCCEQANDRTNYRAWLDMSQFLAFVLVFRDMTCRCVMCNYD